MKKLSLKSIGRENLLSNDEKKTAKGGIRGYCPDPIICTDGTVICPPFPNMAPCWILPL